MSPSPSLAGTRRTRSPRVLSIHTAIPFGALLLILLLTSFAYRSPRTDTLLMDQLGWLNPPVGMYAAEPFPGQGHLYRWTSGESALPLPNPGGAMLLQFRMGGHPGGTPGAEIRVGSVRFSLDVPETIRRYRMLIPPVSQERLSFQVSAPPLVMEGDGRSLGLLLGPVQVIGGGDAPVIILLGAGLLFVGGSLFARRLGYASWVPSVVLAAMIMLAVYGNAMLSWRYAVVGSSMLLMAALSLAALVYEQIAAKQRLMAIAVAALVGVGIPWLSLFAPDVTLIAAALIAVAGSIWLRTLGAPILPAYVGMLLLGVAVFLAQQASGIAPLAPGLLLALFSLSWLGLDSMPREAQDGRGRILVDFAWLTFSAAVAITIGIHLYIWSLPVVGKPDISYIWRDSIGIAAGKNPYERIIGGSMQTNDKYATYFPLFYLLGALVHTLGVQTFESWLAFWRIIFLACDIGTGLLIYTLLITSGRPLLAGGGAAFWLLHRWTLSSAMSANIDFLSIFFLLLSLTFLSLYQARSTPAKSTQWHLWAALLSLSVSLAIKQIAIFLVPLYCIWVWQSSGAPIFATGRGRWRQTRIAQSAVALLVILSLPMIVALPFLAWNAPGFIMSILFSATRSPTLSSSAISASWLLGEIFPHFTGIISRVIIILALLWVYTAVARREVHMFTAGLLTLTVFVGFNPVFFNQYLTWLLPFIVLVACDSRSSSLPDKGSRRSHPPLPPDD